jgi:hypothetical protein
MFSDKISDIHYSGRDEGFVFTSSIVNMHFHFPPNFEYLNTPPPEV